MPITSLGLVQFKEGHERHKTLGQYDSIIIGAGHNGLVCAAYLAKGGHKVLLLEAADSPGGLAASREFHPGFRASVAHSLSHFSDKVAADLDLAGHGFQDAGQPLPTVGLSTDGNHVVVHDGQVSGCNDADTATFSDYSSQMQRFAAALDPFWSKTIPRVGSSSFSDLITFGHLGLNLRRLGKKDMREFLRVASLPARDLMDENFDNETLKAMLSWDGLIGGALAPRSPNSAVIAMLYRLSGTSQGTHSVPAGGVEGLVSALASSAGSAGVELRCSAMVDRIIVDESKNGLAAAGVQLADGEKVMADRVISATDPQRTFLGLVGARYLDIGFTNRIRRLRSTGYVAKLHLALSDLPTFGGLERPSGRMIAAATMDDIEFAFDNAKYGECPDKPVLEIVLPSVHDPAVAPAGQHMVSAHVMYVPQELKGGWNGETRNTLADRAIDTIAQYAPDIREQILHSELLTPQDLAREYRITGGHWHHAELATDQMLMMRPTYDAAQYATPIPGLYLCAAGSHPAGDITGMAGRNAAQEVLK